MLDEADLAHYESALRDALKDLAHQNDLGAEGKRTVELDQQAVGRLSRMDAMQAQAMARATATRREARMRRINAALARLDEGEYGFCTDCGDDIARARLDIDPAVALCLSCARG